MELWSKKVSKHPSEDLRRMKVDCRNEIDKQKKINGRYTHIAKLTPLQAILYWNIVKHIDFIYELIKEGANPNMRSGLGINFFHLYLFLLYYHPIYQTDEHYNLFVKLIRLGMNCNLKIYINNKNYFVLDILYLLQNKPFKSCQFITSPLFKKKQVNYKLLSKEKYDNLILLFLCLGGQYQKLSHPYTSLKIDDIGEILEKHSFFKTFIQEKFKLPITITNEEIVKRVNYIIENKSNLKEFLTEIPISSSITDENCVTYLNPEFIENGKLQIYEYLHPPLDKNSNFTFFHKNFFLELYLQRINLFTREKIDDKVLQEWKKYIFKNFQFPISTLEDCIKNVPFLFHNKNSGVDHREYINFIEEFFSIINPYNHITSILQLSDKQIKYLSHILFYESSLFPKYKQCLKKPNLKKFCDITFFYCKKHPKNISIISYFIEEVFQDFKSYERIKNIIQNLDQQENSNIFYSEYLYRYNEFHPIYMSKFIENILTLNNYLKN